MKIAQYYPLFPDIRDYPASAELVDNKTGVGIEIELENMDVLKSLHIKPKYWITKSDGSLRDGGIEFIAGLARAGGIVEPFIGMDIIRALNEFNDIIDLLYHKLQHRPTLSDRTSVHIHLDIRDLLCEDLYNILLLYVVFEKILFLFVGEEREENNYCIPLYKSCLLESGLLSLNHGMFASKIDLVEKSVKYHALNFLPVRQYGSIEFRHHGGCYDIKRILLWINILLELRFYAINCKGLSDEFLLKSISQKGPENFIREVFPTTYQMLIAKKDVSYINTLIYEGLQTMQDITYSSFFVKPLKVEKPTKITSKLFDNFLNKNKKYFHSIK